jgi:flagellar export protein FliJ
MKRRFRLATVLRLRAQGERSAADALRAANTTLTEAQARVEAVSAELDRPAPAAGTPQHPRSEASADLLAAAHHRARLRDELMTARGEVERLERHVADARQAWLDARAALRAVESLRDRHVLAVRAHDLRAEQRNVDELAVRLATGGAA